MTKKIRLKNAHQKFKELLNKKINNDQLNIEKALELILDFFNEFKIRRTSNSAESDGLLFEYGLYSWNEQRELPYEISYTRQIQLKGQDEFYQISLKTFYDKALFQGIVESNSWNFDFETIQDWKENIISSEIFNKAIGIEIFDFEVSIRQT